MFAPKCEADFCRSMGPTAAGKSIDGSIYYRMVGEAVSVAYVAYVTLVIRACLETPLNCTMSQLMIFKFGSCLYGLYYFDTFIQIVRLCARDYSC